MNIHFQQQLGAEMLRSERRRIIIVISIFLFLLCYRVLQGNFFEIDLETKRIQSSVVWLFPFLILLFELLSLWYVNRRIKSKANKIPLLGQYLNTAFEICIPSLIILTVAKQFPTYNILKSPALSVYFIFIILSTLRLNFFLSLFCGLLSAVSYFVVYFFCYDHFDFNDASRAIILVVSGIAAGLVAAQIKNGIDKSVQETERRHRVENLFGQQISIEIAEKILENNGEIESRTMTVAVMFVDIRNFTIFAAARTAEEVVQYQNIFFAIVSNAVATHSGIVNQFLGDGCMVTFGAPVPLENPALHALKAALEINQRLGEEIAVGNIDKTMVGIGIHTGEVITGNIGTDTRQQYSVTGKCVIIAARVEQLNKEFNSQILITQEVFNHARPHMEVVTEDLGKIGLKGFEEPYVIHKVA
jgi:adenylate cyclase